MGLEQGVHRIVLASLVALLLVGCLGPERLDRVAVEQSIQSELLPAHPGAIGDVVCPEMDNPAPGMSMQCVAQLGSHPLPVLVVVGGDTDTLTTELRVADRLVDAGEVSSLLESTFSNELGIITSVDCGHIVVAIGEGESIVCNAIDPSGMQRSFDITVDANGVVTAEIR